MIMFWSSSNGIDLQEFRPGIRTTAEFGDQLVMACMEIDPEKEDAGHQHPFEQCGVVVEGKIEMFIGDVRRILEAIVTPENWTVCQAIRYRSKTAQNGGK